jgi:ParB family chromosome partitioning protein
VSAKKRGLGRGFSSLIPDELFDESFDPTAAQDEQISELRNIKLDQIIPDPDQPRRVFDEAALEMLASSIKEHGVLQPIVVTPRGDGYMIVAGERRWRAAGRAGLKKIPALVRTLSNQHKLELSLIENLQRRDLNPLETATAYMKLRDQFNMTLDQIAKRMGVGSVSTVSNKMRLLKLPKVVQKAVAESFISEGQARPLIGLEPSLAESLLHSIINEGWSVRKIEQMAVQLKKGDIKKQPIGAADSRELTLHKKEVERLSKHLDTKVKISSNSKGSGRITITFKDQDDLKRIENLLASKAS